MGDGSANSQCPDLDAGGSVELDCALNIRGYRILALQHNRAMAMRSERDGSGPDLRAGAIAKDCRDACWLGGIIAHRDSSTRSGGVVKRNDIAAGIASL